MASLSASRLGASVVALPLLLTGMIRHAHAESSDAATEPSRAPAPEPSRAPAEPESRQQEVPRVEAAEPAASSAPTTGSRAPEVTVRLGAIFPMFLIYENPGPLAGVTVGWPLGRHLRLVARGEVGVLLFDGIQRYVGKLGAGVRASAWSSSAVSPWVQLGFGTIAHLERVGVVLPERTASGVDIGAVVTADIALGIRVARRFELSLGWDHIVVPWSYYDVYTGTESVPNRGYAMASFGVTL